MSHLYYGWCIAYLWFYLSGFYLLCTAASYSQVTQMDTPSHFKELYSVFFLCNFKKLKTLA